MKKLRRTFTNRKDSIKNSIQSLYSLYMRDSNNGYICEYCGECATTLDHVQPLSYVSNISSIKLIDKLMVVPSCQECNVLASAEVFSSFEEKFKYIKEKLKKRYKKLLKMPIWTIQELNELSGESKLYIEKSIILKSIIQKRIDFKISKISLKRNIQ